MILHFFCVQILKKKLPTDPPNFQVKRANKPLFFKALSHMSLYDVYTEWKKQNKTKQNKNKNKNKNQPTNKQTKNPFCGLCYQLMFSSDQEFPVRL